ncbi:MAG: DUF2441 domain-containing protein [Cetobacterium sp.]
MNEYIKLINTGETIKNQFYVLETPGKWNQNSFGKENKINDFLCFFSYINSTNIPNFIARDLPNLKIKVEIDLEIYRQKNFPELPSRLACFFTFDNLESVISYRKEETNNTGKIFEIFSTPDTIKISKHNMELVTVLRVITHNYDLYHKVIQEENLLYKYWAGIMEPFDYSKYGSNNGLIPPRAEYLIEGSYACEEFVD